MKTIFGIFFIVLGIILLVGGIYTGLWIMLVGGIVISIVKILFFEVPIAFGVWFGIFSIGAGIKLALSYQDYYR